MYYLVKTSLKHCLFKTPLMICLIKTQLAVQKVRYPKVMVDLAPLDFLEAVFLAAFFVVDFFAALFAGAFLKVVFLTDFFTDFAALVDDFVFAGTFFEEAFGFDFVFFAVAIN